MRWFWGFLVLGLAGFGLGFRSVDFAGGSFGHVGSFGVLVLWLLWLWCFGLFKVICGLLDSSFVCGVGII